MTLLSSSPQHCLKGERGEIKIILDCFQIVYYDLTISLNIFCEGLLLLDNSSQDKIFRKELLNNQKRQLPKK